MSRDIHLILEKIQRHNHEQDKKRLDGGRPVDYKCKRYRIFIGNSQGKETHPLYNKSTHEITYRRDQEFMSYTKEDDFCLCFYRGTARAILVEDIVKVTQNLKVIWQHPNYSMGEIIYKDVMRQTISGGAKTSIGNGEFRTEAIKIIDRPIEDDKLVLSDGYVKTRVFFVKDYVDEQGNLREVYSYIVANEKGLEEKTSNIIKYIKGERDTP